MKIWEKSYESLAPSWIWESETHNYIYKLFINSVDWFNLRIRKMKKKINYNKWAFNNRKNLRQSRRSFHKNMLVIQIHQRWEKNAEKLTRKSLKNTDRLVLVTKPLCSHSPVLNSTLLVVSWEKMLRTQLRINRTSFEHYQN